MKQKFYDLRHEQDYEYPRGKRKALKVKGEPVMRDIADIDTLVIHQTGIEFGTSPSQIKAAQGDRELALARRALDVACHAMSFRDGFFVASHPVEAFLHQAGRVINPTSVGLEIEGCYSGLEDNPATRRREDLRTVWKKERLTVLDSKTRAAAQAAMSWLVEDVRRQGGEIKKIAPHRIYSDTRRSDPGEAIWKQLVLGFAVPVLGLEPVLLPPAGSGKGRPVPLQWDPNGHGGY